MLLQTNLLLQRAGRLTALLSARCKFAPLRSLVAAVLVAGIIITGSHAQAASSKGCDGGGFTLLGLSGDNSTVVLSSSVPNSFLVRGKYVEFTVDAATFGLQNWTLTGAPNPLAITGNKRTIVFANKVPDPRGLVLDGDIIVESTSVRIVTSMA